MPSPPPPADLTRPGRPLRGLGRGRRRAIVGLAIALVYVSIILFGGCADRMLLHPSTQPINPGPTAIRRTIDFNGRPLEIWTARSRNAAVGSNARGSNPHAATRASARAVKESDETPGPAGYVLEFCGNATRAEQIVTFVADRWSRHDVEAWVVNYPGYGGSGGAAKLASIAPAALAAYDALAQVAEGRPIFLAGNSLGTVPALHVAANRPAAGLVLQNPPPLRQLILGRYGWWNLWLAAGPIALQVPAELNSLESAPRVTAPAVFLIAGRDSLVPPKYQHRVAAAYAGEKRIIDLPAASHWDPITGDADRQLHEAIDWMWTQAATPSARRSSNPPVSAAGAPQ